MGGQNVSCDFWGGKRTIKCPLQTQFWRPQKVGFVWSVPVSGGKRIISGGVQNRFWGGVLWYVFPSPEFSTPLCFSLIMLIKDEANLVDISAPKKKYQDPPPKIPKFAADPPGPSAPPVLETPPP